MVPSWQHGQRERSTPVIFRSKSLADSLGRWRKPDQGREVCGIEAKAE
jgi:hypothetical protein